MFKLVTSIYFEKLSKLQIFEWDAEVQRCAHAEFINGCVAVSTKLSAHAEFINGVKQSKHLLKQTTEFRACPVAGGASSVAAWLLLLTLLIAVCSY